MFWESFAPYFQLCAAFCLSYALLDIFLQNYEKKKHDKENDVAINQVGGQNIINTEGYNLNATLFSNVDLKNSAYVAYLEDYKFEWDPFKIEIELIIRHHRVLFFHVSFVCILYLILSGFEKYYLLTIPTNYNTERLANQIIHQRVLGLLLIPFISTWILFLKMRKVVSRSTIRSELTTAKIKALRIFHFDFSYSLIVIVLSFMFGLLIIWLCNINGDLEFIFTNNIQKIITIFMICTSLLPFCSQIIQMRLAWKRYNDVANDLEREANNSEIDDALLSADA